MPDSKAKEIVVLGGNLAGLGAVHFILRHTIPALQRLDKASAYHVTLVTPNTHFFFKPACPRALIQPSLLPDSKLWRPLSEALGRYPADQVAHLQATATSVDPGKRSVTVTLRGSDESALGQQTISYDSLIIATGTTSHSPLWGLHDDQELTPRTWESVRAALASAKSVLIGGGGAVGVELAGEIATVYPAVEITLVSGGPRLLTRVIPEAGGALAQKILETQFRNVNVVHNVTVTGTTGGAGATAVALSDGGTQSVDLYIDATGATPNSQFLPADWLDATKRVISRDEFFRVRGNGTDDVEGVYAVGDVVAGSANSLMELQATVLTVCTAVGADLAAKLKSGAVEAPKAPSLFQKLSAVLFGADVLQQKVYPPLQNTVMVPIGPSGGVGQLFGWLVPGWFVKWAKGTSFLTEFIDPLIAGTKFSP
ncbi:FAD/NAD(P)-binding domain-containing protein [Thozetella sp. PMI_491]|nr:FAD/NAD(P)-binding domain-containing protein [Thozetella sp. PMI_491]